MPYHGYNPTYARPKEIQPTNTECEVCERVILTKDWNAHKNSKKHRLREEAAKAKENSPPAQNGLTSDEVGSWADQVNHMTEQGGSSFGNGWGSGDNFTSGSTDNDGFQTHNRGGHHRSRAGGNAGGGGGGDDRACFGCGEIGHQKRDCPKGAARPCFNCDEVGHMKADCPHPPKPRGGSGGGPCHNCGELGHRKSECTEPKAIICRNCDQKGHVSRDCLQPKDWSRVKCDNCDEMGHTRKRCPQPPKEDNEGGGGYGGGGTYGNPDPVDVVGTWNDDAPADSGEVPSWESAIAGDSYAGGSSANQLEDWGATGNSGMEQW